MYIRFIIVVDIFFQDKIIIFEGLNGTNDKSWDYYTKFFYNENVPPYIFISPDYNKSLNCKEVLYNVYPWLLTR